MAEKIRLVQGDTRPTLVVTLTDEFTKTPINISGATVRLKFRALGDETVRSTLVGTNTDPSNGVCAFFWSDDPNSLAGDQGPYEGEIEITFSDSTIQTVYDKLKFYIREDF
jgi:hypothetical protein